MNTTLREMIVENSKTGKFYLSKWSKSKMFYGGWAMVERRGQSCSPCFWFCEMNEFDKHCKETGQRWAWVD